jgi:hypothetical protein
VAKGKHAKARATTPTGREARVNRLNVAAFRACDAADAAEERLEVDRGMYGNTVRPEASLRPDVRS